MSIKNMPQSLNGREWSKFKETVIGSTTYSAVVMTGQLTASVAISDTLSVRNLGAAKLLNSRVEQTDSSKLKTEVYQSTASNLKMIDVGGGGGGGNTLYQSPEDFSITCNSGSQIAISGLSYTPVTEQIVKITEFLSSGAAQIYTPATNEMSYSSGNIDAPSAGFSTSSSFRVELIGPDKAYNAASDANQVKETSPLSEKYAGETLASVTNVASGGTTAGYYIDMSGKRGLAIQFEKTGGNDTLRFSLDATLQDDGTAAASCTYQDIDANGHTNISGTTTDSYTADAYVITKPEFNAKYVRVWVAQTGTYGDADYTIYTKKWY